MKRFAVFPLLLIILVSFSLAAVLSLEEPSRSEYGWGTIPIQARLLGGDGNPITNATVNFNVDGKSGSLAYDPELKVYSGEVNLVKTGYYTIKVWALVEGENYTDEKTIYVNSSKIEVRILAPKGRYGPGDIPVKLNILVGGEEREELNTSAWIESRKGVVWNKTLEYPYTALVKLEEGNYVFHARVEADNNELEAESSFTVSREAFYMDLINPKEGVYQGKIPVDVDLWSNGEFVHHANVTLVVNSSNGTVLKTRIPEAQYHYSSEISLGPGIYEIIVMAEKDGNLVSKSVNITIPGNVEVNGTIIPIPGNKELSVKEIWTNLQRRYYAPGVTGTIAISLLDLITGDYILDKNAQVLGEVHYGNRTDRIKLVPKEKPIPHYEAEYTFPDETWYEIVLNITVPGYKRVIHRFPPIKVGKPELKPPRGYEEIKNYIFTIMSPERGKTYPSGSLEIRVQLLSKEGMPVTDANITARIGNLSFPLDYDINGEYKAETEILEPGQYLLEVNVKHNNTSFQENRSFLVSEKRLGVKIVSPQDGQNITNKTVRISARVTDPSGDIVPDAEVNAYIISPKTGTHIVRLGRNLETGNYEVDYQLDSPGEWKVKVVASKPGFLEGQDNAGFVASFEKEIHFTEKDIVAGAVVIASLIVIVIIVRALI